MINYGFGVTLRRIESADLSAMFKWRNDLRIWQWCRQSSPLHWDNHISWFDRQSKDDRLSMFMVVKDSKAVGVCGLTDIDLINRRAEFSLYIDPDCQKKGLGQASLKTLFCHGFRDLGLNRIWGETYDGNPAIFLFIRKLGMDLEGTRKEFYYRDGRFIDSHLIGINATKFYSLFNFKKAQKPRAAKVPACPVVKAGAGEKKAHLKAITDSHVG